jgi:hypothetical protein
MMYSLWFAIPGAFLIVLIPMLPFLILEIKSGHKNRKRVELVRRQEYARFDAELLAMRIRELERENADYEGWLERLHKERPHKERPQAPPYRPDKDLITYIEKGQK